MTITSWFQSVEAKVGLVHVDINAVIGKLISGVELAGHEIDALLQWGVSQSENIEKGLNDAAPVIAAVAGLATTAATGNPAAGLVINRAINGVNTAFTAAEASVKLLNAAKVSLAETGGGTLVNDTTAVVAAVHAITTANSQVANVATAALNAAQAIQAVIPSKPAA